MIPHCESEMNIGCICTIFLSNESEGAVEESDSERNSMDTACNENSSFFRNRVLLSSDTPRLISQLLYTHNLEIHRETVSVSSSSFHVAVVDDSLGMTSPLSPQYSRSKDISKVCLHHELTVDASGSDKCILQ